VNILELNHKESYHEPLLIKHERLVDITAAKYPEKYRKEKKGYEKRGYEKRGYEKKG